VSAKADFHESFWLAVAAAAPIIALANTVTITDSANVWFSAKARRQWPSTIAYFIVLFVAGVNLVLQALVLRIALRNLLAERDINSGSPAISILIYGLIYVLILVFMSVILRRALRREEEFANREASKQARIPTGLGWPGRKDYAPSRTVAGWLFVPADRMIVPAQRP
jgi:hypothetical protein